MTLSPGRIAFGLSPGYFRKPMPAVLIYILSPRPRSTTFVSPVTTCTPAFSPVSLIASTTRASSAAGKPSSIINAQLRYFGSPPHIAISFTVPQTDSFPMLPPGKNIGSTTKLSVENTSLSAPGITAPSPSSLSAGLASAGTIMLSMRREVFFPPLP